MSVTDEAPEEREEDIDAEMSRLLSHGIRLSTTTATTSSGSPRVNVTQDSIFSDSDSEEEEAEVSFILAE